MAAIVYAGLLFEGSSAAFRAESLRALGHEVIGLDTTERGTGLRRVAHALRRRWGAAPEHEVNHAILRAVVTRRPDVLWVDKGLYVSAGTLAKAKDESPGLRSVHYSLDDYRLPGNRSVDMMRAMIGYDLVVTTKSFNVEWLKTRGARRVLMSWQGFDERVHRPPDEGEADPSLAGRVVMVGAWEEERSRTVNALGEAGIPVTVLSSQPEWASVANRHPSVEWRRWEVYGRPYAVAIGSAAIALGVLRKKASDLHTQRSVEIPACGTVLLAERTDEHRALFEEGREAEFYASNAECVEKARALLSNPVKRTVLAEAGRRRCLDSGYSWTDRVTEILTRLGVSTQEVPR